MAVTGDDVYALINRNGVYTIEYFDDSIYLDSALKGEAVNPTATWSGLDHLEGRSVSVISDGIVRQNTIVNDGSITLSTPATDIVIGLSYTHIVEPLPPSLLSNDGAGRAVRLVEAIFRVEETSALRLDVGRGLNDAALRDFDTGDTILDAPITPVSRDIAVKAYGWTKDLTKPLWRIEQEAPLPFTLLSVTTEMKVND